MPKPPVKTDNTGFILFFFLYKNKPIRRLTKKDEAPVGKVRFIRFDVTDGSDPQGYPFALAEACGEQHKAAELVG